MCVRPLQGWEGKECRGHNVLPDEGWELVFVLRSLSVPTPVFPPKLAGKKGGDSQI